MDYKYYVLFGIPVAFFLFSTITKWKKAKDLRIELKRKQIKTIQGLKFTASAKTANGLGSQKRFGIFTIDADVIFTKNEIFFLPSNFTILMYSLPIPIDFNRRLNDYSIKRNSGETLIHFVWEEEKRVDVNIKLTGNHEKLNELNAYLNEWENL